MKSVFTASAIVLFFIVQVNAATIYVDQAASGLNDGTSWTNAYNDIQDAIDDAVQQTPAEIWVAEGQYTATAQNPTVTLAGPINGLTILGGFLGNEASSSLRDARINRTYIDGGGVNRCIVASNVDDSVVIDGFYIRNGFIAGFLFGGGVNLKDSSARFVDCVFTKNNSTTLGGAVAIESTGSPSFHRCEFYFNTAAWSSAAIYGFDSIGATFTSCLFHNNQALEAGAMGYRTTNQIVITNCIFADNVATIGKAGAIFDSLATTRIRNSVFWNNQSPVAGTESVFVHPNNAPNIVEHSNIEMAIGEVWSGVGNINADPEFAFPDGYNYRLLPTSPSVNTGNNTFTSGISCTSDSECVTAGYGICDTAIGYCKGSKVDEELLGDTRIQSSTVDMGAYEDDGREYYEDFSLKNRYISIVSQASGVDTAIRLTLLSSQDFPGSVGHQWWLNDPVSVQDGSETISVSGLACGPVFRDWSDVTELHVTGSAILPNSVYLLEATPLSAFGTYSSMMTLFTVEVWGDVVGPFVDGAWSRPDGLVTINDDTTAVSDKFGSDPTAPSLVICDVGPNVPDMDVNTFDVVTVTDSANDPNHTYPFSGPSSCSCSSNCTYGKCCTFSSCSNTVQPSCTGSNQTWTSGEFCEESPNPCSGGGGGGGRGGS